MSDIIRDCLGEAVEMRSREFAPRNGIWLVDAANPAKPLAMLAEMAGGDQDKVQATYEFKPDAGPDGFTLIAMQNGAAVSVMSVTFHSSDIAFCHEIDLIFTDAAHRGQGHASALAEEFCEIYHELAEKAARYDPEQIELLEPVSLGCFNEVSINLKIMIDERLREILSEISENYLEPTYY